MAIDTEETVVGLEREDIQPEPEQGANEEDKLSSVFTSLERFANDLCSKKSPEASRELFRRLRSLCDASLASGKPDAGEMENLISIEDIPDLEIVQCQALDRLEQMGAIAFSPEGHIIAQLDQIKALSHLDIQKLGPLHKSPYYGAGQKIPTLFYTFRDRPVISREDYDSGVREPKPLFYSPESSDNAFDLEKIKHADFYMGLWEAGGTVYSDQPYPSTEDSADFSEVSLACAIYHPKYGDAHRDEHGRLLVRDQGSRDFKRTSSERLFRGAFGLRVEAQARPAQYVREHLPNLNRSGLLMPEDFRVQPTTWGESLSFTKKNVPPNGSVMIDKVQYYIGKGESFRGSSVYKISDDLAVVTREGKITHVFPLQSPDSQSLAAHSYQGETLYRRAKQDATQLSFFHRDTYFERKEGESDKDYEKRTRPVENFELWSRLESFLGDVGLSVFRSLSFEPEQIRSILSLQDHLDSKGTTEILGAYQKVVKSAHEIGIFIRETLPKQKNSGAINKIVSGLIKRGLNALLNVAESDSPLEQSRLELGELQSETALFAATFRALRDEKQPVRLEDFEKFKFEVASGAQIDPKQRDEMEAMIIKNRMDRPDVISQAQSEFQNALGNPNSRFYILRYDDQVVGFFRLENLGQLDAYLGSLNVPRNIQGSGIGDEILRSLFIEALNGRVGRASADPRNPITPLYIGRYQFAGQAIKPFGQENRLFIEMILSPTLNSRLKFLNAPDAKVVESYSSNDYEIGQPNITLVYPENELELMMQESQKILSSEQYLMSAFRKIKSHEGNVELYSVFELMGEDSLPE